MRAAYVNVKSSTAMNFLFVSLNQTVASYFLFLLRLYARKINATVHGNSSLDSGEVMCVLVGSVSRRIFHLKGQ